MKLLLCICAVSLLCGCTTNRPTRGYTEAHEPFSSTYTPKTGYNGSRPKASLSGQYSVSGE